MVILPSDDKRKARKLLDQQIDDKLVITMLVLGQGQGEDQIASKADLRAEAVPGRRVVWVTNPDDLLNKTETKRYRMNDPDIVVCTLDLDDQPRAHLDRAKAESFTELELAFLAAQVTP